MTLTATAYVTTDDLDEYAPELASLDSGVKARLLVLASDDLDVALGPIAVLTSGDYAGRKYDPTTLDYASSLALRRATCAQAVYRNLKGAEFFDRAQFESVTGPEFTTTGHEPMLGPRAMRELSGSGLILNTTSFGSGRDPGWLDFTYNLDDPDDFDGRPL